jgi:molybdopterin synthase catalytic subunit
MDYLKTRAVFWKKEASTRGGQWIESTEQDRERSDKWANQPR